MSLKKVHAKLEVLSGTSSSNAKKVLLKKYLKDKKFKTVIRYALDQRLKFHINKTPVYSEICDPKAKAKAIFKFLDKLNDQTGASNQDKNHLLLLASTDKETHEVVQRIVKKDLRCGTGVKLINDVVPNTIFYRPYMRCSTDKKIKNIVYGKEGAIAQEKADGTYVDVDIDSNAEAKFWTRNYSKVHQLHKLKSIIKDGIITLNGKKITDKGFSDKTFKGGFLNRTYQGELVVVKNGKVLDRKTGNGIINQCIQKTALQSDADCVVLRLWDSVPEKAFKAHIYDHPYNARLRQTVKFIASINNKAVALVETQRVFSLKEAEAFYKKMRKLGKEGAVLKNVFGIWKDGDSPNQIKMKNVIDVEARLIAWKYGDSYKKYEKCIGTLCFETDDKQLKFNVGTGLSELERGYKLDKKGKLDKKHLAKRIKYYNDQIGNVYTTEAESVIKDKKKKTYSLFLPRNPELRFDRNDTDTLEDLLKR